MGYITRESRKTRQIYTISVALFSLPDSISIPVLQAIIKKAKGITDVAENTHIPRVVKTRGR